MMLEAMPISALAEVQAGGGAPQDPSAFTETGHPFVRAGSLPKLVNGASEESLEKLEPAVAQEHGLSLFPTGTVLFAKSGMSATKGHIYRLRYPAYVVNHLAALIPHDLRDSAFLVRVLQRFSPTAHIKDPAYPSIRLGDIENMRVLAPPDSPGRRRIAEVLDRAEALRAKRRAALDQLDTLTQAVFLDLFGDVARNDRNWPSEQMGNLMRIRRGGSPRPIEKYLGGDINWIKIGDATRGSDIYLESCANRITSDGLKKTVFLKAGSLIFANCGVSLGFARILRVDGCIHDGWLSFEEIPEDKLDKLFLLKALNSITAYFRKIAPDGTQPNLNTGMMKHFRIILPPISLQHRFARDLTSMEKVKAAHRASLAKLDALFASLQHRAFRGEL